MWLRSLIIVSFIIFSLPLTAREFPLCLYGVTNPADLKTIKQAGFNCIQSYTKDPDLLNKLAEESSKQGLKVVFQPSAIIDTQYEKKARRWPILAWYLVDEPDVHHWSRERVLQAHQRAKAAFPNHQTALVIGQGKTDIPYYDIPDVMMVDWYPVPHLPLTSFGDNVRYVKEELAKINRKDHPIWGVVQIFDWKNFKQFRSDDDRIGRFPTEEEIRFMSYHGILNGATGLFYFTFNHQGKPLPQSAPEYWQRVKRVTKELARFKKIVENGSSVDNPLTVEDPLQMQTWKYKGHTYSVMINLSQAAQPVPFPLTQPKFKILYGDVKTDKISPHQVWVIKH